MRPALLLVLALAVAGSGAAHSAPIPQMHAGVPVLSAAERAAAGPYVRLYYAADVLELTLAPNAAHGVYARAAAAAAAGAPRLGRTGIGSLDAVAASLGGATFTPEFAGEHAPDVHARAIDFTRQQIVHLPESARLEDAIARFAACPEVERVSPIAVTPLLRAPNDSLYAQQWWLHDPIGHGDIDIEPAWDLTTGDPSIVVALLDSGVLPYHPDLGTACGNWGNLWTNPAELNGLPGVDDDGDGFVDDVWGWDFVSLADSSLAATGEDWRDADNDPNDMVGHGTACAGLIAALTDNTIGMAGVAWKTRIMPLRVAWADPGALRGDGEVRMDFAAQAIRFATRHGARVISMSFSNLDTDGLGAAVTDAVAAGISVVVASGNNGSPSDLGPRPDVISVAATDRNAAIPLFANVYDYTTLAAPGTEMQSLWSVGVGTDSLGLRTPAYSPPIEGTSFSTPQVAGAAALVEARRQQLGLRPLDAYAMKLRLVDSARDVGALLPLLDVAAAVEGIGAGSAIAMGATTVGPAAVIPVKAGDRWIACVASDSMMVMLDGVRRDTLWTARLADQPVTGVAAAQMGAGYGVGLFCGTAGGTIEGFDVLGRALPGFPTAATGIGFSGGPALGDLDGDGKLEIVCGADNGTIMAWHADGSGLAGWPRLVGSGQVLPVALANLDGAPGVEVVAACTDGNVTALRASGGRLPGWPKLFGGAFHAPVIDTLGATHDTCIVITDYDQLHVLNAAGVERAGFPVSLGGPATSELALADLDGDGRDDIVLPIDLPARMVALHADGTPLSASWPRVIKTGFDGSPVIGALPGAAGNAVLMQCAGNLLGLDTAADSLHRFPQPGQAGAFPTIADIDGDGIPEIVAGSGPDPGHHFYIYKSGSIPVAGGATAWLTPRANSARTGSPLNVPSVVAPDVTPPARVTDLAVIAVDDTTVVLRWSATGDDSTISRPAYYDVRAASFALVPITFDAATLARRVAPTADAGAPESLHFGGLPAGARLHFALRAVDAAGNRSLISNDVSADLHVGGPIGDGNGLALAPRTNPGSIPLDFYWHADPSSIGTPQRLRLYDITGRVRFDRNLGGGPGGVMGWDGRDDHGNRVGAGIYFARLASGAHTKTVRVVLLP